MIKCENDLTLLLTKTSSYGILCFLRVTTQGTYGAVAQLGERLNGIQEVRSSILLSSTSNHNA